MASVTVIDILKSERIEGIMRPLILVVSCLAMAWVCAYGQTADAPTFEIASVKPASPSAQGTRCSGGPGTTDPGTWTCSNVPLAFLISNAYGFEAYQFSPRSVCCQARFDFVAKVPAGTTKERFQRMLQNLLVERFQLTLHHEQKEMASYELNVGEKGPKMKESAPDAAPAPKDPWRDSPRFVMGKDGYPVFPAGQVGLAGGNGHYRWTGVNVSMQEIVKTLSFHLGRPVVDATGLKGKYDVDMTWTIDLTWIMESAGLRDQIPEGSDDGPHGPTLIHAVRDQLGLELISKKVHGDIVVVDHVAKVPSEN
jgi:uncharacterized protein (TIGR03435 family)